MNDIETAIQQWIAAASLHDGPITLQSRLVDEGWLDSLQIVQLVEHVEQQYGVAVDLDQMIPENFETIGAVAALVRRSPKSAKPAS